MRTPWLHLKRFISRAADTKDGAQEGMLWYERLDDVTAGKLWFTRTKADGTREDINLSDDASTYVEIAGDTMTGALVLQSTNANIFLARDATPTTYFKIDTSNKFFGGLSGMTLRMYSDAQTTRTFTVDGATGTVYFGDTTGVSFSSGAGSPEGVVTAPVGSMYLRNNGGQNTTLFVKTSGSGNTGWTNYLGIPGGTLTGELAINKTANPAFTVATDSGASNIFRVQTSTPRVRVLNGATLQVFSDDASTTVWEVLGTTGEMFFGDSSAIGISTGSGSPEGVVTRPVGSLYLRSDGSTSTTLYVKTSGSGNTGWTAK